MDFVIRFVRFITRNNVFLILVSVLLILFYFTFYGAIQVIGKKLPISSLRQMENLQKADNSNGYYFYHKNYQFIHNITQYPFFGEWTDFNFEHKNFINKNMGEVWFTINKKISDNYLLNLENQNTSTLMFSFVLRDGKYVDSYFKGNFSFSLPENFYSNILKNAIEQEKPINLNYKNMTLNYFSGDYLEDETENIYNSTEINITISPKQKIFHSSEDHSQTSNSFSLIGISIQNKKNKFSLKFSGEMYKSGEYPNQVLNYSIIITILSLVQIYYSMKLLVNISENNQLGLNMDLFTVSGQIVWDCLICAIHFFLALVNESTGYEYGLPSFTFFLHFSIFQLRIFVLSWKSRNLELMYQDISLYRKKFCKLYSAFYGVLFLFLISLRYWVNNFYFTYTLFFSTTWLFQIYHSASTRTKPPMSYGYIFVFTISKMFFPLYLKACPFNIYGLRPAYGKSICISVTLLIEAIILSLQKLIGPKFVIPKFLREESYNYYIGIEDVPNRQMECVVCLEKMEAKIQTEIENAQKVDNTENSFYDKFINLVDKLKDHPNKTSFMRTPCQHIFHSHCLEKWLELKNECPYCRNKIPPLED